MKKLFSMLIFLSVISCSVSPKDEARMAQTLANKTFIDVEYSAGVVTKDYIYFGNDYRMFNINNSHYYTLESMNSHGDTRKKLVNLYYTNNNHNTSSLYKRQVIEITEYRNSEHGLFYKLGGNNLIQ